MKLPALPHTDVVVVGAGIIGLACALELRSRGAQITVLEKDTALSHASTAAAGMLAAHDPFNPPELGPIASYSVGLYTNFLANIEELSGQSVPYQTHVTQQYGADGTSTPLAENSIDPRQLSAALLSAVKNASVRIEGHTSLQSPPSDVPVIYATGAWSRRFTVAPRKGQMLRVQLPSHRPLAEVHRSESVYVVPRLHGPQSGTALIGATIEDAGFDTLTNTGDLQKLRDAVINLNPALEFLAHAPAVEAWAGLRPATRDLLPILGNLGASEYVATGHYRNGILLAPATAKIMADLIEGLEPAINLHSFRPQRFSGDRTERPISAHDQ